MSDREKHQEQRPALYALIQRLKTYAVDWTFSFVPSENVEYEPGVDREIAELDDANVVSSERKGYPKDCPLDYSERLRAGERPADIEKINRHAVLLDIDYPAYLVPSSSPGKYHLYLDVPNGVKHDDYMELLEVLGRVGVIERGYAEVSIKRGHSDLRLPHVHKSDQVLHQPDTDTSVF